MYYLYKDKLYGFCYKLLASDELSKEVVQETFVRLWEKRANLNVEKSLNAYIYTIAKNLVKDHQARYVKEYEVSNQMVSASFENNNAINDITFSEIKKMEERVVSQLPPQQKEVYKLSRYNQLSNGEIAEFMGISVNSVKTHLRLALKTLREHISPISDLLLIVISILSQS